MPFAISRLDASPFIVGLWALGFALSLCLLAFGQHRFLRRLGARRAVNGVHVAETDSAGPAVVGVIVPRIVVPADFEARYTPAERELVLAHERAHIRAGDVQVNALAAFAAMRAVVQPAGLHRARRFARRPRTCLRRARDAAPRFERRAYAEAMLKTQLAARAVPLGCPWPPIGAQPLKQRITALGRPRVAAIAPRFRRRVCFAATLAVALTPLGSRSRRAAPTPTKRRAAGCSASAGAQLVEALQDGDVAEARELIAAGADVNHWIPGDGTPLIIAARFERSRHGARSARARRRREQARAWRRQSADHGASQHGQPRRGAAAWSSAARK